MKENIACFPALDSTDVRGLDTLSSFPAIFQKGGNFYNFLFAFLDTKHVSEDTQEML